MASEAIVVKPEESLTLQKVGIGLFKSGLFPNAKNEYGAFAIVEYGAELGVGPMMALKNINIISGQVACNAQLMLSLALRNGVTYTVKQETDTGAIIEFKRGEMSYTSEFSKKDAESAGLLGKDNWKKYPKDMYFWRCVAKGVRRVAPDAVMGLYTPDEITEGKIMDVTEVQADVADVQPEAEQPKEQETPRNFGNPTPPERGEIINNKLHQELSDYCRMSDGEVDMDMYRTVCVEISTFEGTRNGKKTVSSFDDPLSERVSAKWAQAALGKLRKKTGVHNADTN
jgi:hypothetical protein